MSNQVVNPPPAEAEVASTVHVQAAEASVSVVRSDRAQSGDFADAERASNLSGTSLTNEEELSPSSATSAAEVPSPSLPHGAGGSVSAVEQGAPATLDG